MVVLSARDEDRLRARARDLSEVVADLDLASMCHTLQSGREPMAARLAFLARDVDEAAAVLRAWLAGAAENVWTGCARQHDDATAGPRIATSPDDAGELARLAAAWVEGAAVDWQSLYPEGPPGRCSLPTYPFAGDRYGFPRLADQARGDVAAAEATEHPLIDRQSSGGDGIVFHKRFAKGTSDVDDHRVAGRPILPGAAYLEMVRSGLARSLPEGESLVLTDVVFKQPLEL